MFLQHLRIFAFDRNIFAKGLYPDSSVVSFEKTTKNARHPVGSNRIHSILSPSPRVVSVRTFRRVKLAWHWPTFAAPCVQKPHARKRVPDLRASLDLDSFNQRAYDRRSNESRRRKRSRPSFACNRARATKLVEMYAQCENVSRLCETVDSRPGSSRAK